MHYIQCILSKTKENCTQNNIGQEGKKTTADMNIQSLFLQKEKKNTTSMHSGAK